MTQCCKTCLHSRWFLTPTGRIVRNLDGKCVAEIPEPVLPESVPVWMRSKPVAWGIKPTMGGECPLWERNDGPVKER